MKPDQDALLNEERAARDTLISLIGKVFRPWKNQPDRYEIVQIRLRPPADGLPCWSAKLTAWVDPAPVFGERPLRDWEFPRETPKLAVDAAVSFVMEHAANGPPYGILSHQEQLDKAVRQIASAGSAMLAELGRVVDRATADIGRAAARLPGVQLAQGEHPEPLQGQEQRHFWIVSQQDWADMELGRLVRTFSVGEGLRLGESGEWVAKCTTSPIGYLAARGRTPEEAILRGREEMKALEAKEASG